MTLQELVYELNNELKFSTQELTNKNCFAVIRREVSGASRFTSLQLLLLATIVSSKGEFQERVLIEIHDDENQLAMPS